MRLVVGQVVRAHGIRGEVVVRPSTDRPALRFVPGATLDASDGTTLTVRTVRPHGGRLLVALAGVSDRSAAERLARLTLTVDVPDDAPGEHPDEYYDAQLVGLQARAADGSLVGTVTAVEHGPAQDLLVLDPVDRPGSRLRVPFVAALVPQVALADGWLQVDLPPGLADLGAEA